MFKIEYLVLSLIGSLGIYAIAGQIPPSLGFVAPQVITNPSWAVGNPHQGELVWYDEGGTGNSGILYAYNGAAWNAVGGLSTSSVTSYEISNLSIATSVSANALTVSIKDQAGNDPSSDSPVGIAFRDSTASNGSFASRTVNSATSLTISAGSTLGTSSGIAQYLYVYAVDNAGTVELAVANGTVDEGSLQSTTAEGGSGGADSANVLYAASGLSTKPVRLIGRILISETTAGSWATNATELAVIPFHTSNLIESTSGLVNYTFTVNSYGDLTSIVVPSGEWDFDLQGLFYSNGTTAVTNFGIGLSTVSGNSNTGLVLADNFLASNKNNTSGYYDSVALTKRGVIVNSPTTYYLKATVSGSISLLQVGYKISARRIK